MVRGLKVNLEKMQNKKKARARKTTNGRTVLSSGFTRFLLPLPLVESNTENCQVKTDR
jgi:hypothetical protein